MTTDKRRLTVYLRSPAQLDALREEAWGYKDGVVWAILERVLAGEL